MWYCGVREGNREGVEEASLRKRLQPCLLREFSYPEYMAASDQMARAGKGRGHFYIRGISGIKKLRGIFFGLDTSPYLAKVLPWRLGFPFHTSFASSNELHFERGGFFFQVVSMGDIRSDAYAQGSERCFGLLSFFHALYECYIDLPAASRALLNAVC